jgi:hypothetical protein
MSTRPRINWNLRLSPTHRIVNVGWSSGFFVEVTIAAEYKSGGAGSRFANIELTANGEKAGGKIIGQRSFEIPGVPTVSNPKFQHRAVLRFNRPLKEMELGAAFNVNLSGSTRVTDPNQPDFHPDYFCGTSTSSGNATVSFQTNPVNGFLEAVWTFTMTTSSPAGSDTVTTTYISGVNLNDLPTSHALASGSDDEIWYEDAYGSLVNTHLPCSDLPLDDGGGPPPPARIEGFNEIRIDTRPANAYTVAKTADWEVGSPIMAPKKPDADNDPKNKFWAMTIGQIRVGITDDFDPYFDDIGDGQYGFRVQTLMFTALPKQGPKQANWTQPGVFPTATTYTGLEYSYRLGAGETGYDPVPHTPDEDSLKVPSAVPPSSAQAFDQL